MRDGSPLSHRALRPGGTFIFNVWDQISENEFADEVTKAAAGLFPGDPAEFLARTPHGYYDIEAIREALSGVGFASVAVETVTAISAAPSPRHPAIAFCQGTPLKNEIEARDPALLAQVVDHAESAIAARFGDGPVQGKIQAHVFTATK